MVVDNSLKSVPADGAGRLHGGLSTALTDTNCLAVRVTRWRSWLSRVSSPLAVAVAVLASAGVAAAQDVGKGVAGPVNGVVLATEAPAPLTKVEPVFVADVGVAAKAARLGLPQTAPETGPFADPVPAPVWLRNVLVDGFFDE